MGTLAAQNTYRRLKWTSKIRPMVVGAFFADLMAPERRTIVESANGLRFFIDPLSNFGEELVKSQNYEVETENIIRQHLFPGDTFLDVGANEGYFTTVAASIVGPSGKVIAVEPQSRLCDIIEINLSLNQFQATVHRGALGGERGTSCQLFRYPSLNTGAASVVRKPKLYSNPEQVQFIDPTDLLSDVSSFSFVKVDVEGFEKNVVESLLPLLQQGKIKILLLDYHATILEPNGINPADIHATILQSNMTCENNAAPFSGYRLYFWAGR